MGSPIILLGHGSQNPSSADEFTEIRDLVQRLEPGREIIAAYLQLCKPDLDEVFQRLAIEKIKEVIIIPVFLFFGNHIYEDIPGLLKQIKAKYPQIQINVGRHIGPDMVLAKLISDRIHEIEYRGTYLTNPEQIEERSFEIIDAELGRLKHYWNSMELEVVRRVVHTTADPTICNLLDFHPKAIAVGIKAMKNGVRIITDVRMSLIGIGNKVTTRFGSPVECLIDDPEIAVIAKETGKTRAMAAIIKACTNLKQGIIVIGNAPTALFQLCEMVEAGIASPDLIIGTPVGFVGAAESKEVLRSIKIPYIRTKGPRGGSPIAAAIVNALFKLAESET